MSMARSYGTEPSPTAEPKVSAAPAASVSRAAALSEARRKAWETRRRMYGPQGHDSTYNRGPHGADPQKMLNALVRLLHEGTLSEGQAAKATGLDRITLRRLEDEYGALVEAGTAPGMEALVAETSGLGPQGNGPFGLQADVPSPSPSHPIPAPEPINGDL